MEIGNIFVRIGAKIDDFEKGMSTVDKAMSKVGERMESIGKKMTVAGAVITGAIGLIVKKTADLGDHFYDLSQRTGIAVETLSSFKLAADKSGTSIEGFAIGMRMLANRMADAANKGGESAKAFEALGVSIKEADGSLRPMDQVLMDLADRFKALPDGAQKSALAMDLFGRSGTELIPLLNLGRKGLEENAEAAKKLGIVWSTTAAKGADNFNDKLVELKAGFQGASKEVYNALLPSITALVQKVTDITAKIITWSKEHPALVSGISKLVGGIGLLLTTLGTATVALGWFRKHVKEIKAVCANPIVLTITVILPAIGKFVDQVKDNMGLFRKEVEATGKGVSGLSKIIYSVNMAWDKYYLGIDAAKLITKHMNLALGATAKAASGAGTAISKDYVPSLNLGITKTKSLAEELNLIFKKDLEQEIKNITKAIKDYKGQLAPGQEEKLRSRLLELEDQLITGGLAFQLFGKRAKAVDPIIKEISETIETTAIPAARNLGKVWREVTGNTVKDNKKATTEIGKAWENALDDMAKAFGEAFADIMRNGLKLKDFFKSLFQGITNIVATLLGSVLSGVIKKAFDKLAATVGAAAASIFVAFAAIVGTGIIKQVLEIFGVIDRAVSEEEQKIIDKMEHLKELGVEIAETITAPSLKKPVKKIPGTQTIGAIIPKEFQEALLKVKNLISSKLKGSIWELNDAWEALISSAKKFGLEGSEAMVKLILAMRAAGKESAALTAYVQEQLGRLPAALSQLISFGGSIQDQASLALHAFNSMLASGMSFTDALDAMAGPLSVLRDKYKELGLTADPALQRLFDIIGMTEAHRELFDSIQANKEVLEALGNSGWLTADALAAITNNAKSYYTGLKESGLTAEEALRAMAPTLQKIYDYATAYGIELDEETKSLIEQAKAIGVVKEAQKSTNEVMGEMSEILGEIKDVLKDILNAMRGDVTRAADKVRDVFGNWKGELRDVEDVIGGIGDKLGSIKGPADIGMPEDIMTPPGFQHGGIAWTPQVASLAEAGPEAIIPLDQLAKMRQAKDVNIIFNVTAWDGKSVIEMVRNQAIPEIDRHLRRGKLKVPITAVGTNY